MKTMNMLGVIDDTTIKSAAVGTTTITTSAAAGTTTTTTSAAVGTRMAHWRLFGAGVAGHTGVWRSRTCAAAASVSPRTRCRCGLLKSFIEAVHAQNLSTTRLQEDSHSLSLTGLIETTMIITKRATRWSSCDI